MFYVSKDMKFKEKLTNVKSRVATHFFMEVSVSLCRNDG